MFVTTPLYSSNFESFLLDLNLTQLCREIIRDGNREIVIWLVFAGVGYRESEKGLATFLAVRCLLAGGLVLSALRSEFELRECVVLRY